VIGFIEDIFSEIGRSLIFLGQILKTIIEKPSRSKLVFEQIWDVTVQSLGTTAMAGFFVGAIMSVQFAMQLRDFGALGYLGGLSTSATIRELGPLLIAFMLSGKVGAYTSAELGTMKVTEQIDAIRCLGADPLQEIIVPRFLGIIISSFFLLGIGLMMSIFGGTFLATIFAGVNYEEYFRHIPTILAVPSVVIGLFKCLCFAVVLATICTYRGYTATGGAKGVGRGVVLTAVATMTSIVVIDWLTSFTAEVMMNVLRGF
jgi:phospholipid/cholesterol/gamma-HCH transport system permease protein